MLTVCGAVLAALGGPGTGGVGTDSYARSADGCVNVTLPRSAATCATVLMSPETKGPVLRTQTVTDASWDAEILMLRHQLAVAGRHLGHHLAWRRLRSL
jgi:hypothetical protein